MMLDQTLVITYIIVCIKIKRLMQYALSILHFAIMIRIKISRRACSFNLLAFNQSRGTELINQSRGTELIKQSRGTELINQSRGTELINQSRGTELINQSRGTELIRDDKKAQDNWSEQNNCFSPISNISRDAFTWKTIAPTDRALQDIYRPV